MSVVGRFEIVSPIFSGALDTSTARDPQTGDTVLLHLLPAGQDDDPRELFRHIAADWPGEVLDSGYDSETHRSFVVTEYPKDRKAFRVLIHTLSELTVPTAPVSAKAPAKPPEPVPSAPVPGAPLPAAPAPAVDPAADLLAFFKGQSPAAKPSAPAEAPAAAPSTRMFDPSAVFGASAAPVPAMAKEPPKAAPVSDSGTRMFDPSAVFGGAVPAPAPAKPAASASDSGTRMFDPSAVFGGAVPAPAPAKTAASASDSGTRMFDPSAVFGGAVPAPAPAKPAASASDSGTRMFDPSAVFGGAVPAPAPAKPTPAASPSDSGTRMFDPSAVFGAAAATPAPAKPKELSDSSKRAAEDFISGRLPPEFRDAPVKVQRSLEELLGKQAKPEADVPATPGRPGVITLMFDSYGKRIESAEAAASPAEQPNPPAESAGARATKMISSADLSTFFGADSASSAEPSPPEPPRGQERHEKPPRDGK